MNVKEGRKRRRRTEGRKAIGRKEEGRKRKKGRKEGRKKGRRKEGRNVLAHDGFFFADGGAVGMELVPAMAAHVFERAHLAILCFGEHNTLASHLVWSVGSEP